jgi:hypothetical protein
MIADKNFCAIVGLIVFFLGLWYTGHFVGGQSWGARMYSLARENGLLPSLRILMGILGIIVGAITVAVSMFTLDALGVSRSCW